MESELSEECHRELIVGNPKSHLRQSEGKKRGIGQLQIRVNPRGRGMATRRTRGPGHEFTRLPEDEAGERDASGRVTSGFISCPRKSPEPKPILRLRIVEVRTRGTLTYDLSGLGSRV
ncbi:hypothetical protein NC652_023184 [Populus alba x Populus x berolinensis]|nr:hypothetical protein NC652_023184 [Populus alba x Populus x berolinensis]